MDMKYKEDFGQAQKRIEAWWDCEIIDRPCVQIKVRRKYDKKDKKLSSSNKEKTHNTWRKSWFDIESQLKRANKRMKSTIYMGESFPAFVPDLGPDLWATLYGADLKFSNNTSWAVHFVEDWDQFLNNRDNFKPNFDNEYWQTIKRMVELSLEKGEGKYLTGLPDFHPGADLLAALRDVDKLCIDLIECPDKIKQINNELIEYYPEVYNQLYDMIKEKQNGTTTWLSVFHENRFYVPSSDFSALISNQLYKNVFLPGIIRQVDFLDRSIYHLDGPDALRHLDTILDIEKLDGVQWVYGAGNGNSTDWVEVYKKIQKAGKCIQILVNEPEEIEVLMDKLSPEGLLFTVSRALDKKEAAKVIEMVKNKM